jgi:hypothetical protein
MPTIQGAGLPISNANSPCVGASLHTGWVSLQNDSAYLQNDSANTTLNIYN